MDGVQSERATDVMTLSWLVMEISDVMIDLGMFAIRDNPEHPKSARDDSTATSLILECLWEEHDTSAGPWV
jgi:hypothetical protein